MTMPATFTETIMALDQQLQQIVAAINNNGDPIAILRRIDRMLDQCGDLDSLLKHALVELDNRHAAGLQLAGRMQLLIELIPGADDAIN